MNNSMKGLLNYDQSMSMDALENPAFMQGQINASLGLDQAAQGNPVIDEADKYAEVFKALAQASEGMTAKINPNIPGLLQARPYQPVAQQPMPQQVMPNAYMQMLQNMMNRGY